MTDLPRRRRSGERMLIASILFVFGAAVAWQATSYELGSLRRMGPGYFPLLLGFAECVIAILIVFAPDITEGAEDNAHAGSLSMRFRAFGFVLAAMIVFAGLIRTFGFLPATAMATLVAGLAEPDNGLPELALLALAVAVFTSLVFIAGLGIPVPLVAF